MVMLPMVARSLSVLVLLYLAVAAPAQAAQDRGDQESAVEVAEGHFTNAMWLSIAHPGLGEWYLQGWGHFERCPQKKFWLGFIPLYGWPGYLQVKSAIDAGNGRTNDSLTFE